ncbi:hypothetical protein HS088_TW01G00833 [Tripterygium wilfordii]|uniref:Uncharacterized protein n=1 Tax=Tripterygium wilfordii TaxID=458696 RepID=A0A7J7E2T5_TRIWF|nr:hypothetical protein HS088_TW01G00833 [Tripterygium wilfordii]
MSAGTKQVMYKCVIVLAILASREILVCEGRPIKSTKLGSSHGAGHEEEGASHNSVAGLAKEDFRPTGPRHSPGVGHHSLQLDDEENVSDFRPTEAGHSPGLGHSRTFVTGGAENDFRPTGPGHSPGVGHRSLQLDDEENVSDLRPTEAGLGHSRAFVTGGAENDFRPTGPGHSPGVGHKVEQEKHTVAIAKDDFRPTDPGHSPGIGHH